jgi:adenine-specific DNA-methyltransferase
MPVLFDSYLNDVLSRLSRQRFRFIGSKYKILPHIYGELVKRDIIEEGKIFFDAFSGSAIVGSFFKKKLSIISNDMLYFSYALQNALIVMNDVPKFELLRRKLSNIFSAEDVIYYLNNLPGREGFIYMNYTPASREVWGFERKYFTEENGKKIDAIREQIEEWYKNGFISEYEFFYLLSCLLFAVQKVANISGTYGAYNKFWDKRALKPINLTLLSPIRSNFTHKAFWKNILELAQEIRGDIAYLDPPYNSRQYIANYHILETIARNDKPQIKGVSGIRNSPEEKSPFCSRREAKQALYKVCRALDFKYIVISYNDEGILSPEEIHEILTKSSFKNVELIKFPHRRFKSNSNTLKRTIYELLFVARR